MEINGRDVLIRRDGVTVAGARTKTINFNNEPIDGTTSDSDGFRELYEESAERHLDLSIEGLLQADDLVTSAAQGSNLKDDYTVEIEGIGEVAGEFRLNSLQIGAPYNDSVTFTGELQSSGAFTFTPAAS